MKRRPCRDVRIAGLAFTLLIVLRALPAAGQAPDSSHALCTVPAKSEARTVAPKAKKQALAHLDRARKAYESREFGEALYELRAAYDLNPLVDVLFNLAQVCREAGREEEALHLYEQTLSQATDDTAKVDSQRHVDTLRFKLSAAAEQRAAQALLNKDYAGAIKAWEAAYKLSKQPASLFHIAESYRLNGQVPEALAAYTRYLEAGPNDPSVPRAKEQIGQLRAGQEDARATQLADKKLHVDAIAGWESAYQLSQRPIYMYRIAESQQQLGEKGKARRSYERYLKESLPEDQPELRANAERYLAQLKLEASAEAERARRASEKPPLYKKWWLWTIVGGVVVAAVAGGVAGALLAPKPPDPFADIPLGNQRSLSPQ
jgi:tetratricopeptide (TPR) repeat protein